MFPTEDTLLPVARIVKSYGTAGEVMVSFKEDMPDLLKTEKPVWLLYDGLPVPFFILSLQLKGQRKAIVRFEDIDSHEDAEEAAGKDIYIDPTDYPELSDTDSHHLTEDGLTLEDLIGFTLLDQKGETVGTIAYIQDFSGNICLELSDSGTLVPFHDDLIIDIDIEKKTLTMSISEGLL
ncbi:MAG TPA: ribosome maturation factor RimM [Candidatus Coprenecus stercoravium]|uniref:Ribosome maturation factor RimM n=1 Tax=Candidatus Coprenecus stercoravium TaxID=2840735 RepID=A0A9D2K906_9BACT|nr:ribosome maturation factor RimM [Candidatus Coprenecus stercoravium]